VKAIRGRSSAISNGRVRIFPTFGQGKKVVFSLLKNKGIIAVLSRVLVYLGLLAPGIATATAISYTTALSAKTTNWNRSLALPQFSSALGTLRAVTVTLTGYVDGQAAAQNLGDEPDTLDQSLAVNFTGLLMGGPVTIHESWNRITTVSAFVDSYGFSGTDAVNYHILLSNSSSLNYDTPAAILGFVGKGVFDLVPCNTYRFG
jgi:hypothetical protein